MWNASRSTSIIISCPTNQQQSHSTLTRILHFFHYDLDKGHFKRSPAIDSLQVIHDHALSVYELSADAR